MRSVLFSGGGLSLASSGVRTVSSSSSLPHGGKRKVMRKNIKTHWRLVHELVGLDALSTT